MKKLLCVIALLTVTSTAYAVDFSQPIYQIDGSKFTDKDGKPSDTQLKTIAVTALLATIPGEGEVTGEDKAKRYALALKIQGSEGDVKLTSEEIVLLKKLIAKVYNPLVMGEAWQMLEPGSIPR